MFGYPNFREIFLLSAVKSLRGDLITPSQNTSAKFPSDLIYSISFTSFLLQCIN